MEEQKRQEIFQSIDDVFSKLQEGKIVKGEIVGISPASVVVSIGFKSEGILSLEEFEDPTTLKIGDEVEVLLERIVKSESILVLSKRKADEIKTWKEVEKSLAERLPIRGKLKKEVKGGHIVDIKGVEAFLPNSQLDTREEKKMGELIGQSLDFKVIKFDKEESAVTLSRRLIAAEEFKKKKAELFQQIEEGQIVEGTVKSITEFGAFVDIGGADGLVHITDLSWGKVTHPSEKLKEGEKVKVKILKIEPDKQHISLGIKQLTPYPWENIEDRYPISSKVKGKVTALIDYGAFVELEPGVEGLIHISELSWTHVSSPNQILGVGDTIQVIVLAIDKKHNKISLSLRQTQPNPWEKAKEIYPEGKTITGTVKSFSKSGAFIELKGGLAGYLPLGNLSWTEHIDHPSDVLTKGKSIRCKIISVDPENQRIVVGLKQLSKDPLIDLKNSIGETLQTRIKEIGDKGIVVKFPLKRYKIEGFVPIVQLVESENIKEKYNVGEGLKLKLTEVDPERRRVIFSEL